MMCSAWKPKQSCYDRSDPVPPPATSEAAAGVPLSVTPQGGIVTVGGAAIPDSLWLILLILAVAAMVKD